MEPGGIARRDADFNVSDVLGGDLPRRRFIAAGRAEDRWYLWYEKGGYTIGDHLVLVLLPPGERAPRLLAKMNVWRAEAGRLCPLTNDQLTGRSAGTVSDTW